MDEILLIDKPKGWTSFDVVAKIRGELRRRHQERGFCTEMQRKEAVSNGVNRTDEYGERVAGADDTTMRSEPASVHSSAMQQGWRCKCRVGHSGTLDPMATGLLIVLVGAATKRQDEFMKQDKVYEAEITFGATSTTDDAEGELTPSPNSHFPIPTSQQLEETLKLFMGEIDQMPPNYSAIKINGQKAYDLARAGKQPELKSRKVTMYSIELTDYEWPKAKITCHVSSGTYIRSLARDLGQKLGCGAYLSALRRTKIGKFIVSDAKTIENFLQ